MNDKRKISLKIEDLETKCEKCKGRTIIPNPNFTREDEENAIKKAKMALKEKKLSYYLYNIPPSYIPCDKCNGIGGHPTKLGRDLLDFVSRHLKIED